MLPYKNLIGVAIFAFLSLISYGQSEKDLIKESKSLFKQKNYLQAKESYLKLLSINSLSSEYNYFYGLCLYFDGNTNQALKHLSYVSELNDAKAEYHYYFGRALHSNYQFKEAITQYNLYESKKTKKSENFDTDQLIINCENGGNLIQIGKITNVLNAQTDINGFYNAFKFNKGRILPTKKYNSKIDKKKKYISNVYYPDEYSVIKFYSSYGDKDNGNTDIFKLTVLSNGNFKKTKLNSNVNTELNEKNPFYDYYNNYLYFSSEGHNSIGGFDLYRSKYDVISNSFEKAENLGKNLSTPGDDYIFLIDSSNTHCYIASNHNSKYKKLKIIEADISFNEIELPNDILISFFDHIDEQNQNVKIEIINSQTGEKIGTFKSNNAELKIKLKEGEYEYIISTNENNKYSASVSIPKSQNKTIEQSIHYELNDLTEEVHIKGKDSFDNILDIEAKAIEDEKVEEETNDLAQKNNINENQTENEILKELSFEKLNKNEIVKKVSDQILDYEIVSNDNQKLIKHLNSQIIANRSLYEKLEQIKVNLKNESNENLTKIERSKKLNKIKSVIDEQNNIIQASLWFQDINDSLHLLDLGALNSTEKEKRIKSLSDSLHNYVMNNNNKDAYEYIIANHKIISQVSAKSYNQTVENDRITIQASLNKLKNEKITFEEELNNDKNNIKVLLSELQKAKKKDKKKIQQKIEDIERSINLKEKNLAFIEQQIIDLNEDKQLVNTKKSMLAEIALIDDSESHTYEEAKENYFESFIVLDDQLAEIKKEKEILNQELNQQEKEIIKLEADYTKNIKELDSDQNLNKGSIIIAKINLEEKYKEKLQDELTKTKDNDILKNEILEKIQETENSINTLKEKNEKLIIASTVDNNQNNDNGQVIVANTVEINNTEENNSNTESNNQNNDNGQVIVANTVENNNSNTDNNTDNTENNNQNNDNGQVIVANTVENNNSNTDNNTDNTENNNQNNDNGQEIIANTVEINNTEENNSNTESNNQNNDNGQVIVANTVENNNSNTDNNSNTQSNNQNNDNGQEIVANTVENNNSNADNNSNTQNNNQNNDNGQVIVANSVENNNNEENNSNTESNNQNNDNGQVIIINDLNKEYNKKFNERLNEFDNNITESDIAKVIEELDDNPDIESHASEVKRINNEYKKIEALNDESKEKLIKENKLKQNIQELITEIKYEELNDQYPNAEAQSTNNLIQKNKMVDVNIEIIENEISILQKELKNSKEKESQVIKNEINELSDLKIALTKRKEKNNYKINIKPNFKITLDSNYSSNIELSETEKIEILSNENYKDFAEIIIESNKIEENIKDKKQEITILQNQLKLTIAEEVISGKENTEKSLLIKKLEKETKDKNKLIADLKEKQKLISELTIANNINRKKYEYLVLNEEQPIQKDVIIAEAIFIPQDGFDLNTNNTSSYSEKNPIPINVKAPSGLVYRVQVGAFRRPIPQNLYKEFRPVSGEKLKNGLTVYMAGYFNSQEKVLNARKEIRSFGYSDAFVVAYCNGKRIKFWEAKKLEANGECIPLNNNEFFAEIVKKTSDEVNVSELTKELIQKSVNNKTNSESKNEIENNVVQDLELELNNKNNITNQSRIKSLYYSVQIGVYNRAVKKTRFPNINEVLELKLENGQYRYSSGVFNTIDFARERRKKVIRNGISDAFIVAYYNGKRISISKAKKILLNNKELINQSNIIANNQSNIPTSSKTKRNLNKTQTILFPKKIKPIKKEKFYYQYVSNKQFNEFPEDKINILNQNLLFIYNNQTNELESAIIDEQTLPDLIFCFNNQLHIKRITEKEFSLLTKRVYIINEEKIPGDLMDELIRLNLNYKIIPITKESTFKIIFENIDSEKNNLINSIENKYNLKKI